MSYLTSDTKDSLKWNSNTFTGLSGVSSKYGLMSIADLSLISSLSFKSSFLSAFQVSPKTWFIGQKGFFVEFQFFSSIRLKAQSYLVFSININVFPLVSVSDPNTHCKVIGSTSSGCQFSVTSGVLQLRLSSDLDEGNYSIQIQNLSVKDAI